MIFTLTLQFPDEDAIATLAHAVALMARHIGMMLSSTIRDSEDEEDGVVVATFLFAAKPRISPGELCVLMQECAAVDADVLGMAYTKDDELGPDDEDSVEPPPPVSPRPPPVRLIVNNTKPS